MLYIFGLFRITRIIRPPGYSEYEYSDKVVILFVIRILFYSWTTLGCDLLADSASDRLRATNYVCFKLVATVAGQCHTEWLTERQTERQSDKHSECQTSWAAHRVMTDWQGECQIDRQFVSHSDRVRDWLTERFNDRPIDRLSCVCTNRVAETVFWLSAGCIELWYRWTNIPLLQGEVSRNSDWINRFVSWPN